MLVVAEQWMIGSFRPALAVALGRMDQVILTLVSVARRLAFVLSVVSGVSLYTSHKVAVTLACLSAWERLSQEHNTKLFRQFGGL